LLRECPHKLDICASTPPACRVRTRSIIGPASRARSCRPQCSGPRGSVRPPDPGGPARLSPTRPKNKPLVIVDHLKKISAPYPASRLWLGLVLDCQGRSYYLLSLTIARRGGRARRRSGSADHTSSASLVRLSYHSLPFSTFGGGEGEGGIGGRRGGGGGRSRLQRTDYFAAGSAPCEPLRSAAILQCARCSQRVLLARRASIVASNLFSRYRMRSRHKGNPRMYSRGGSSSGAEHSLRVAIMTAPLSVDVVGCDSRANGRLFPGPTAVA